MEKNETLPVISCVSILRHHTNKPDGIKKIYEIYFLKLQSVMIFFSQFKQLQNFK